MRTIIAGSRTIGDHEFVGHDICESCGAHKDDVAHVHVARALLEEAIKDSGFEISTVICGMARGMDLIGHTWADDNGIPVEEHRAQWKNNRGIFNKVAGLLRNIEMGKVSQAAIVIHNGSNGSRHMIDTATRLGLRTYVKKIK